MAAIDTMVFSDAQAITLSGNTTGTNILDMEFADPNLGAGTPLWLWCRVGTTLVEVTSGSDTLQGILYDCATSGGTWTQLLAGFAFSGRECVKGLDLLTTPLPRKHKRYLRLLYATATGSGWSAGNIDAFLTLNASRG